MPLLENIHRAFVLAIAVAAIAGAGLVPRTCEAQPTFDVGVTLAIPVVGFPTGFTVGDLNGDAFPDVAITEQDTTRVGIRMGNGTGGFGPVVYLQTGTLPTSVAIGDFNGDGRSDLVTANYGSGTLSVFLGLANGSFLRQDIVGGTHPRIVAVGDFNVDGKSDLAIVSPDSTSVTVKLAVGYGRFTIGTSYPTGSTASNVTISDVNSDGALDLITANENAGNVSVLLGTGLGTFGAKTDYSTGSPAHAPLSVAAGDWNADGKPDLAVANHGSNTVALLPGDGLGHFGTATQYPAPAGPQEVVLADLTGDAVPDVAARTSSGVLSIYPGISGGGLGPSTDIDLGTTLVGVSASDVNGDGNRDVLVLCAPTRKVVVLLGHGSGDFGDKVDFPVGNSPAGIDITDISGDGKLDVVVANYLSDSLSVLLGNGSGGFASRTDFPCDDSPGDVVIRELTGNPTLDVAVVSQNESLNRVSVLEGNGSGGFGVGAPFGTGSAPRGLAVGDLSGEGSLDLAVANAVSNTVSVLLNNGSGSFAPGVQYATGIAPLDVAIGNVDGDGDLDVVALYQGPNVGSSGCSVLKNNGSGTLTGAAGVAISGIVRNLALGDADSDGDLDLLVSQSGATVNLFLNNGTGLFANRTNYVTGASPFGIAITDIDSDGRVDLVAACAGDGLSVLLGDGAGKFGPHHHEYPAGDTPQALAIGDLDGNGKRDVVITNAVSNNVSVLLGRGKTLPQLAASPARCQLGSPLTLTATVGSLATGNYVPTGSVRFFDGFTPLGSAPVVNGVATLVLPAPYNSTRAMSAEYLGDRRFHGSFSKPIKVEVFTTSVGVPGGATEPRFGLESVWPNPVLGDVGSLRFDVPESAPVRVDVFDVQGRRVVERDLGALEPGPHTVALRGLDALTPGLYFVRLVQGPRSAVGRFTRLQISAN